MGRIKTRAHGYAQTRVFDGETYAYGGYIVGVASARKHAEELREGGYKVRLTIPRGIGGGKAKNIREVWKKYKY